MKFNNKLVFKDYKGGYIFKEVSQNGIVDVIPLTFQDACIDILNAQIITEILTAEQKNQIYKISIKLCQGDEVTLTPKEIAFIQERADVIANAQVRGLLYDLFESSNEPLIS